MKTVVKIAGYILTISLLLIACTKGDIDQEISYNLRGKAEKGPFVQGGSVTVTELNASLAPTGRSFIVDINNYDGSFSLNDIELLSPYVLLNANGFYFNEVSGKLSDAQINLMALVDLRQSATVNINLLTHLERLRVEKLLSEGNSFPKAKTQAQQEVLAVFGLSAEWLAEQAVLCDNDAILLTVSSILQGFRSETELTELLDIFANDIAQNGKITNKKVLEALSVVSHISAESIRNNLLVYYQSIGLQENVPNLAPVFASIISEDMFPEPPRNMNIEVIDIIIENYETQTAIMRGDIQAIAAMFNAPNQLPNDKDHSSYIVDNVRLENNIFKLHLNDTVPEHLLLPVSEEIRMDAGIIVSDINAKTGIITIETYCLEGNYIGRLWHGNHNGWSITYVYADRDFTMKGTSTNGVVYNCTYKKGWNMVYSNNSIKTTVKPEGEEFKWYLVN